MIKPIWKKVERWGFGYEGEIRVIIYLILLVALPLACSEYAEY